MTSSQLSAGILMTSSQLSTRYTHDIKSAEYQLSTRHTHDIKLAEYRYTHDIKLAEYRYTHDIKSAQYQVYSRHQVSSVPGILMTSSQLST
ncbi:Hypothetical predicted protein, partial [Olea europaea subsp. europaea]